MPEIISVGTRTSQLAVAQTDLAIAALQAAYPTKTFVKVPIVTRGDRDQTSSLQVIGGQGAFVKALERALLTHTIDIAIHSLKDVTTRLPAGLVIGATLKRADPYDCLITTKPYPTWEELPQGARIGTNASRRQGQLLHLRPDLEIVPIRGNVDTRLHKLVAEDLDAVVLVNAGLDRLQLDLSGLHRLSLAGVLLPAPGQGAIAVECRQDETVDLLAAIDDRPTHRAVAIEREFLKRLGGSCRFPFAGFSRREGNGHVFDGLVATHDGRHYFHEQVHSEDPHVGLQVAEALIAQGALEQIQKENDND
ncbi:hydroxymethylbilane synthase [Lacticaseibacillus sp. GG6-2]